MITLIGNELDGIEIDSELHTITLICNGIRAMVMGEEILKVATIQGKENSDLQMIPSDERHNVVIKNDTEDAHVIVYGSDVVLEHDRSRTEIKGAKVSIDRLYNYVDQVAAQDAGLQKFDLYHSGEDVKVVN